MSDDQDCMIIDPPTATPLAVEECAQKEATADVVPMDGAPSDGVKSPSPTLPAVGSVFVHLHLSPERFVKEDGTEYEDPDQGEILSVGGEEIGSKLYLTVEKEVAAYAEVLDTMFEDCDDATLKRQLIPIPNVTKPIAEKIFGYYRKRNATFSLEDIEHEKAQRLVRRKARQENKKDQDNLNQELVLDQLATEFFNGMPNDDVIEIAEATNYLQMEQLLDESCAVIAGRIEGKTAEEIRVLLNIENDWTPEEEAKVREENAWCEEIN